MHVTAGMNEREERRRGKVDVTEREGETRGEEKSGVCQLENNKGRS